MEQSGRINREVRPGEFYRHFKNKLYQIVAVAVHSETGEPMVVYQALYGDYKVYVRPYEMFISPVDREKYPDAAQEYRFERVEPAAGAASAKEPASGCAGGFSVSGCAGGNAPASQKAGQAPHVPDPSFLRFLEAVSYEERMECLNAMAATAGQQELDSIYLILDMKPETGSIREQLRAVERFLTAQNRYDGRRLR
ncbi:MAG: DUF1653 domain-containing protein [Eubacteriales bacterium]|nr:DUF1653 domain-containing protein [Eubacteriales bacterium]